MSEEIVFGEVEHAKKLAVVLEPSFKIIIW